MGNRQAGSPARPSEVQRAPVWQIFFSSRGSMCVLVHAVPPVTAATMRCEVHLHRAATPTRCNREGDEMSRTFCPHPAQLLRGLAAAFAAGAVLLGSVAAQAQDAASYPNKPIRIIVPRVVRDD